MAAKKYMNHQSRNQTYTTPGSATATGDPELLDASGQPVHAQSGGSSPLRSNPNVAWIADPELRSKNLERLKSLWSQRNQR